MDLRQLRYFIAIVEAGSVSRAAERLRVAQPALSQHVRAMEAALGLPLLIRNPRGVLPTEAGLRLLEQAREIEARFARQGFTLALGLADSPSAAWALARYSVLDTPPEEGFDDLTQLDVSML